MIRRLLKLSLVCVAGTLIVTANPKTVKAFEEAVAGYSFDKDSGSNADSDNGTSDSSDLPIPGYTNLGIVNVDVNTHLLIRKDPSVNGEVVGKLPKDAGCDIIEDSKDGWTKISAQTSSGDTIKGYVKSEYLITGSEATQLAKKVGNYIGTSDVDGLRLRKEATTDADIIDQIAKGEELIVIDSKIITDDPDNKVWVKISLDSDADEGGSIAYVAKKYLTVSFELPHALSLDDIKYGSGVSQARINIVKFAREYLGGRYVWGGTRLGSGVDCSGFTQAIYRNFGISIPRTSRAQATSGREISSSELKPGDLVFYGSSSYINHVAMYIGNGRVIHASNHRDGIKISNINYRHPVTYVSIIH